MASWRSLPSTIDADQVGERRCVLVVVRDEQRREPELVQQLLELASHRHLRVRVEGRERLVEQQHARVAGKRAGERDPLALTARELGRYAPGKVRDAEPLEELVGAAAAAVGDVLAHGHVREERVLLEDEPDPALARAGGRALPPSRTRPRRRARSGRRRPHEPGDRAQDRGLARAGRADERDRPVDLER